LFGNWLNGVNKKDKERIRIGVSAFCWSIWTTRNDIVFNKQKGTNFLQVILRAAHWIQLWAYLLPEEQRDIMVTGCNHLLTVTRDCYFQATGWRHVRRIEDEYSLYNFHLCLVDPCCDLRYCMIVISIYFEHLFE
jgi:hypothetical protein